MALDWLWWQTKLFHTTLSQIPFTHNFVTQAFHTQLCHTQLFHTHTTLSHTTLSHTTLVTYNFHTKHFYVHKLTRTHTHNTFTHSSFTQPVLHHLLSCLSHLIFTSACDHWKKLICGVIRPFNFTLFSYFAYLSHCFSLFLYLLLFLLSSSEFQACLAVSSACRFLASRLSRWPCSGLGASEPPSSLRTSFSDI